MTEGELKALQKMDGMQVMEIQALEYLWRFCKHFMGYDGRRTKSKDAFKSLKDENPKLDEIKNTRTEPFRTLEKFMWVYSNDGPLGKEVVVWLKKASEKSPSDDVPEFVLKKYAWVRNNIYEGIAGDALYLTDLLQRMEKVEGLRDVQITKVCSQIQDNISDAKRMQETFGDFAWDDMLVLLQNLQLLGVDDGKKDLTYKKIRENKNKRQMFLDCLNGRYTNIQSIRNEVDSLLVKTLRSFYGKGETDEVNLHFVEGYMIGYLLGENGATTTRGIHETHVAEYLNQRFKNGEKPLHEELIGAYAAVTPCSISTCSVTHTFMDDVFDQVAFDMHVDCEKYDPLKVSGVEEVPESFMRTLASIIAVRYRVRQDKKNIDRIMDNVIRPMYEKK